jgi:hypothetical protein
MLIAGFCPLLHFTDYFINVHRLIVAFCYLKNGKHFKYLFYYYFAICELFVIKLFEVKEG